MVIFNRVYDQGAPVPPMVWSDPRRQAPRSPPPLRYGQGGPGARFGAEREPTNRNIAFYHENLNFLAKVCPTLG